MRTTWANILEAAEGIRSRLQTPHDHFQRSHAVDDTSADNVIRLDLSLPIEPKAELSELRLPPEMSERISAALNNAISKLRASCDAKYKEACMQLTTSDAHPELLVKDELFMRLRETFQAIFLRQTNAWIKETKRLALSRVQQAGLHSTEDYEAGDMHSTKRPFNQDYIPILEAFFTQEQFPSRADKLFLAKKSSMTYRQIHVWFQNRRSRTRKTPVDAGLSRGDSSDDTDIEETPVKSGFSSRASSFTLVADEHPFELKSPPHAFPGKYPPDFDEKTDPFPCRFGNFTSLPKAIWVRKPSALPIRQGNTDTDVDALSEAFGKLRIHSSPIPIQAVDCRRIWGSYTPRLLTGCDVLAAYTTRPLSAPIPSFIRYPYQERYLRPCTLFRPQHRDSPQTERSVSPSRSHSAPFNYKSTTKKKRVNKPRLPKRVPTNSPKLSTMTKSLSESLGLAHTDEANSCTRGRTSTSPLDRVALATRSTSSSSDESLPSLTPSYSSSLSSEAQSPSSPAQALPYESSLCFLPECSTTSIPDASKGLPEDIPLPPFVSSDFNFDLLSSKPFANTVYDLAFSHLQADSFLSLQLHPQAALPQSLPFSSNFAPLIP